MADVSNATVVLLGMGVVFTGLISIIVLCKLMGLIMKTGEKPAPQRAAVPTPAPAAPVEETVPVSEEEAPEEEEEVYEEQYIYADDDYDDEMIVALTMVAADLLNRDYNSVMLRSIRRVDGTAEIPNRQEFMAAVSAAIAEMLGKDVSGIRIHSVRRV